MSERFIKHNDIELWTESFGDPKNPAILLIMGIGGQGIIWPDGLCRLLAQHGFFVIRFDNRDTGKSSIINFSKNPYDLSDMTDDAIAILDGYGIDKAAVVGASMGGVIAQIMAMAYPARVSHLVLMMTTPDISVIVRSVMPGILRRIISHFLGLGNQRLDLPKPSDKVVSFFRSQIFYPFKSRKKQIETAVNAWRIFSGGGIFDEDEMRKIEERACSRSGKHPSFINHSKAIVRSLKKAVDIQSITQPTLIIHGSLDPIFPPKHGKILAQEIRGAQLEIIPGMGHIIPEKLSEKFSSIIIDHLKNYENNKN